VYAHLQFYIVETNSMIFFSFAVQLLITIVFFEDPAERGCKCTTMAWSFLFPLLCLRLICLICDTAITLDTWPYIDVVSIVGCAVILATKSANNCLEEESVGSHVA
jgi:hypothetical protein